MAAIGTKRLESPSLVLPHISTPIYEQWTVGALDNTHISETSSQTPTISIPKVAWESNLMAFFYCDKRSVSLSLFFHVHVHFAFILQKINKNK